jgi:hypothetical protein
VSERLHYRSNMMRKLKMKQEIKKKWASSRIHEKLLVNMDSEHRCIHTDANVNEFREPSSRDRSTEDWFCICIEDLHVNGYMKQCRNIHIMWKNCTNVDKKACFISPPFIHSFIRP